VQEILYATGNWDFAAAYGIGAAGGAPRWRGSVTRANTAKRRDTRDCVFSFKCIFGKKELYLRG